MKASAWKLSNGVEANQANPRTFHIPSEAERWGLKVGDIVKLRFEYAEPFVVPHPRPWIAESEKMWVEVVEVRDPASPTRYGGAIENDPCGPAGLKHRDPVNFGPEHVLQIYDGF